MRGRKNIGREEEEEKGEGILEYTGVGTSHKAVLR
jgi:hypothetical protein